MPRFRPFFAALSALLLVLLTLSVTEAAAARPVSTEGPHLSQLPLQWATNLRTELAWQGQTSAQAKLRNSGNPLVRVSLTLDGPERCPEPLDQKLHLLKGAPFDPPLLVAHRTSYSPLTVTLRLPLDTRMFLTSSARCLSLEPPNPFIPSIESPGPFALRLVQNDDLSNLGPKYVGSWVNTSGASFSGGTTHEARQIGANVTVQPGGFVYALTWVTTRNTRPPGDPDQDQARVACDRVLCATVSTGTSSNTLRRQVVGAGNKFDFFDSDSSTLGSHRLQVIADDGDGGVDVDAFLLVEACDDLRANCYY